MDNVKITFVRNGRNCSGKADKFVSEDEKEIIKAYFAWKELNEVYSSYGMRRANFPELLSEGLTALMFGWYRTNNSDFSGLESSSMDLLEIDENGEGTTIQLKACSTDSTHQPGPTSFGPRTEFDKLIFMWMDCTTNTARWYELKADEYTKWQVNRNETIEDQQAQGRRPRLTILPKVKEHKLEPFYTYEFKR